MSDPEVIGDRHRYAEVGRASPRSLEPAAKLAEEWRHASRRRRGRAGAARRGRGRRAARDARRARATRIERARGGDPPRDGRARPQRRQERDRRDPRRRGRRRGRPLGRRPLPDAHRATPSGSASRPRRWRPPTAPTRSRSRATAPTRSSSSRAAPTASSACPRPSPRAASTPRRRRSRCCPRPRTSTSRIDQNDLQIDVYRSVGPGRPVGQHDRLGGAHHAQADRHRGLDAGREVPAAEPREGDARAARAPLRGRAGPSSRPSWRPTRKLAGRHGRPRGEDPHLQLPASAASPTTASSSPRTTSTTVLGGELDEFTGALQDDEKRRRLEEQAGGGRPRSATPVRDALDSAAIARSRRRAATRRAWTPRSCSPTCSASTARALIADSRRRARAGDRRARFSDRVAARAASASRWPTSYRRKGFRTIELAVDRRVLIPRPETEHVVEAALGARRLGRASSTSARGRARSRWRCKHERPDLRGRSPPT